MTLLTTHRQPNSGTSTTTSTGIGAPDQRVRPRHAALIAGVSYLGLFFLGLFANFFVLEGLIEPGDATATVANIRYSEGLFRAGLVGFLAIFVLDLVIAWALHIIFMPINRDLSLLTAWFRLVYTTMLGVAVLFFFLPLELSAGPTTSAPSPETNSMPKRCPIWKCSTRHGSSAS